MTTKEEWTTELAKFLFTVDNQGLLWLDADETEKEEYLILAGRVFEWLTAAGWNQPR